MNAPFRHGPNGPRPDIHWQTLTHAANRLFAQGNLDGAHGMYLAAKAEADRCMARARFPADEDPEIFSLAPMMLVISWQNLAECAESRGKVREAETAYRQACLDMLDTVENEALATGLRASAARHLKPALSEFATWLQRTGKGPAALAAIVARGQHLLAVHAPQTQSTHH